MSKEKSFNDVWENIKNEDDSGELAASEMVSKIITKLIKIRKEKNITQRDLASKTGIKQSAIARIETLSSVPQLNTVAKLANALNVSLEIKD